MNKGKQYECVHLSNYNLMFLMSVMVSTCVLVKDDLLQFLKKFSKSNRDTFQCFG